MTQDTHCHGSVRASGRRPVLVVTMGDAAGVGPELCLRLLADAGVNERCVPVVFGDADILHRVAEVCALSPPPRVQSLAEWNRAAAPSGPIVVDCSALDCAGIERGRAQAASGRAAFEYIRHAVTAAVGGRAVAVVTAPINKTGLRLAGIDYPGHTEILAELTGAAEVRMMFACDELIVTLVTIHLPYAALPARLGIETVRRTIEMTADTLARLGRKNPRIAVCGLNPHAGEQRLFGDEESRVVEPAIAQARAAGLTVTGPLSPDTAFLPRVRAATDAYVAMYHDQGLIPFKMLAFERGVNITLGLPIVRTSPDHGTAYDIAWRGMASPLSMFESVNWALRLAASP